jgi:hypothetical protein
MVAVIVNADANRACMEYPPIADVNSEQDAHGPGFESIEHQAPKLPLSGARRYEAGPNFFQIFPKGILKAGYRVGLASGRRCGHY